MEKTNNVYKSTYFYPFFTGTNNLSPPYLVGTTLHCLSIWYLDSTTDNAILADVISNQVFAITIETVISIAIILVTGISSQTLFKIINVPWFFWCLHLCYILFCYPISPFFIVAQVFFILWGTKTNKETPGKHLHKNRFGLLYSKQYRKTKKEKEMTMKLKYSKTPLISPMSKYVTAWFHERKS